MSFVPTWRRGCGLCVLDTSLSPSSVWTQKADWGHTKQTRASDSPVLTPECSEVQLELLVVNVCSKLYSALFQNKLYFKLKSAHYRTSSAHVLTSVMSARYWQVQCGTEFVTLSVEQCVLRNYINSIHLSFQTVQSAMPISYMFMLHLSCTCMDNVCIFGEYPR